MGKAPRRCPMCGERRQWRRVDTSMRGFGTGKSLVGQAILGRQGWWLGHAGRRCETWCCGSCRFRHTYG